MRRMSGKPAAQAAQAPDKKLGDTGLLYVDAETNSIPVARTEAALSELTDCINHKDKEGFTKMALDGKVMIIDANTPVRLIGLGGLFYSCRRIRILSGDFRTEDGWVPREWVR